MISFRIKLICAFIIDNKVIKLRINNTNLTHKKVLIIKNNLNNSIQNYDENLYDHLVEKAKDIPTEFIKFYINNVTSLGYVVDLEKLTKWLEIKKENLKRLLENNFKEDEDYTIEKKEYGLKNGKGGNLMDTDKHR